MALVLATTAGAAAPRNGLIAYLRSPDVYGQGAPHAFVMGPNGEAQHDVTPRADFVSRVSFSPGGSRIAFAALADDSQNTSADLWIAAADGSNLRRLTNTHWPENDPVWSPDGRWIAFVSCCSHTQFQVWRIRSDGTGRRHLVTRMGRNVEAPAWSPRGNLIAFVSAEKIWTIHPDGSGLRGLYRHAASQESAPAWSPDGRRLAFESGPGTGTTGGALYVARPDGSGRRRIARGGDPAWSPDGRWIAFAAGVGGGKSDIYKIRPDGTGATDLTRTPWVDELRPSWQRR